MPKLSDKRASNNSFGSWPSKCCVDTNMLHGA
jgi:hypothetical protein